MAPASVAAIVLTKISRFLTWVTSWPITAASSLLVSIRLIPSVTATAACSGLPAGLNGNRLEERSWDRLWS